MEWTKEKLKALRNEISLCSLYTHDFDNSFNITPESCQNFFEGYADYLAEVMIDDNVDDDCFFEYLKEYDTAGNLWNWYNCFEGDPFVYEEEE